jgi:D-psicose/D-tagatose/L-ribulose 3-epimerase
MKRRTFLQTGAGVIGAAMSVPEMDWIRVAHGAPLHFRYSVCNEVFEKWDFAKTCRAIRDAGFEGIEISPFTLAENLDQISVARRRELRDIIRSEGLAFAGLHWLLVTPKGLHVTTAEKETRIRSWNYVRKLVDFCADLGDGGIMVFGSPKQRGSQGNTREEATRNLRDGLAAVAPHAGERGVTILIEPLPSKDTDVVNTLEQAVRMLKEINNPAIQTMFDFHNTPDEQEPFEVLVKRYYPHIRHIHVNEMDGRYPGTGRMDYLPVFQTLVDLKYSRWVSLEVFDFKPGPVEIVRATMQFYRNMEKRLRFHSG